MGNVQDIMKEAKAYCCFVDASWVSPTECAGIGWVLYNDKAQMVLKGMASIPPTNSSIEAEAEALRSAMMQVRRLGYEEVKFCVDASILYQNVAPYLQKDKKACPTTNSPLAAYIQDIQKLATISASFVVSKVNSTINDVADHLAKVARSKKMQYVISWTHEFKQLVQTTESGANASQEVSSNA
ncbi:Polynucleotidyl transferase, ribonuclease H-like superfamily protein [Arabidopsis thaliana]|uniref:Polynucleotidyl transferase, ribonuclease H-like superfamily protein n=1 Tax=Arabidopsis thaliana TaxID=3702 RepID=F4KH94_ARATH|nr:Polynucleotidyl transferase, ribonuclease H-like superfamily protein [Arabidopsis thaliana]AED93895.1 Polynucleotidyl transferase, ribonuclease H-like superfamily protein [Arabidopsis thaliana]|eukprot:NP_198318.2 Polynucleotidyl transferase, ribonuclease H-like superfamily protein [Arabidopsis thaliana]